MVFVRMSDRKQDRLTIGKKLRPGMTSFFRAVELADRLGLATISRDTPETTYVWCKNDRIIRTPRRSLTVAIMYYLNGPAIYRNFFHVAQTGEKTNPFSIG